MVLAQEDVSELLVVELVELVELVPYITLYCTRPDTVEMVLAQEDVKVVVGCRVSPIHYIVLY